MTDLVQYLDTPEGEEALYEQMQIQRDAFENKFGHGACGVIAVLLRSNGVGCIESVTVSIPADKFYNSYTTLEHYVTRTPKGKIIDPSNPYLGNCIRFNFRELSPTEMPVLVKQEEIEWLQENVLDQLPMREDKGQWR